MLTSEQLAAISRTEQAQQSNRTAKTLRMQATSRNILRTTQTEAYA